MTEEEYIAVSNLQRARDASAILQASLPGSDPRLGQVLSLLSDMVDDYTGEVYRLMYPEDT